MAKYKVPINETAQSELGGDSNMEDLIAEARATNRNYVVMDTSDATLGGYNSYVSAD